MNRNQNLQIRYAVEKDCGVIAAFNAAMAWETEHLQLEVDRLREGVQSLFRQSEYGFYLIAEWDGQIAGQTMITYEWSDWRNGVFWWIQSVYVCPEYRNRGIFRAILAHIEAEAKAAGNVCGVRLYVESANQKAREVYRRLGFQETSYQLLEKDYVICRE